MTLSRVEKIRNGEYLVDFAYFKCDICGFDIPEMWSRYVNQDKDYCCSCAFINNLITEDHYLDLTGDKDYCRAFIKDGVIIHVIGNKLPTERKNKRKTPEYKKWRQDVFSRDNYTCQYCGQRGGELNAHHIKTFKDFVELRHEINNGVTLCVDCHRKVHGGHIECPM